MGSHRILGLIDESGEPRRAARRKRMMLVAKLATPTATYDVIIRDVSATGARVEGRDLPGAGRTVRLTRGTFAAYGRLVWINGSSGGLEWDEPFDEDELIEALRGIPAAPCTKTEPYRRPGFGRAEHPRFSDGRGWIDWGTRN